MESMQQTSRVVEFALDSEHGTSTLVHIPELPTLEQSHQENVRILKHIRSVTC